LFAENRPTRSLQTSVKLPEAQLKEITGAIGVGTWETSAEYKDVRVERAGQVLFESDFSKGTQHWKTDGGDWSVVDGAYRQNNQATGLSFYGDEDWSNYILTLKARKIRGNEGFLVCFARKGGERNWWNIGGWGNREHAIEFNQNSLGRHLPGSIEVNRWYDIKVDLSDGRRIRCYLDGKLIHDEPITTPTRFFSLAGRDNKTGDLVIKTINAASEPIMADLNIDNAAGLEKSAQMIVLKSDRAGDNNSLENPKQIVPIASSLPIEGAAFAREFPANSLTILRIPIAEVTPAKNRAGR
jgi:alpha-L-arabinofuranosidase